MDVITKKRGRSGRKAAKLKGFLGRGLGWFLAVALVLFMGPWLAVPAQAATSVDTFAELKAACQSSGTVTITAGISLTDTITIPSGVTVYLTCTHEAGSTAGDIGRAKGFHGHMFKVNDGATLYIRCCINGSSKDADGNLRGTGATGTESDGYYGQAMILNYGHVIMDNDKSVLKNNYNPYNNDYKTGLLWTYSGKKYYGLGSGGEGETDLSGSAILCVNGKFTMSNGQIYGCIADNGSAIYVCNGYAGDVIKISGGKIHDNIARRYGGAIFAASRKPYSAYDNSSSFVGSRTLNSTGSNGLVQITGGSIYKNLARLNSGAVWVGFGGTFYMSGGSIYSNTAVEEGGGGIRVNAGGAGTTGGWMCFANPGGQAWIAGGSIYSNTCATNGGGITVPDNDDSNNQLKITGGNIYSNTAGGNGGGVYIGSKLVMSGGNVYKNKVNGDASKGGGIYMTGTATGTISGGKVYSNTAVDNGGGVSSYGSLTVSGGFFYGNAPYGVSFLKTGKITGGRFGVSEYSSYTEYTVSRNTKAQIHVGSGATLSIAGGASRVVSALASGEAIGDNVGILNNGTTTVETSCNADNGYMDLYGTGTSIQNSGTLNIKGKMNIMTSSKDGLGVQNRRGIYNSGTVTVSGELSIRYCGVRAVQNAATGTFNMDAGEFYGNQADGNGGAVYNAGIFRMTAGSMHDNTATGTGGAVYCGGEESRFNMSGGSLYNNSAGGMGGAVYYTTNGLASRISGGSIYKNTAGSHGGAIASYRTNIIYISGGDIYSNTATGGGGAVFNAGTLHIEEGAKIRSNTAGTYGGAIHNTGAAAVVKMSGGAIYSNKATNNGGGIYNGGTADGTGGQLTMSGGSIYSNTSDAHGGGVYFTTDGAASTLSGGAIYSNTAANGGGISSFRANGITLSGVNVYKNTATGTGGGVRSGGKLTISAGAFYGNNAVGVYVASGTLTISGGKYGVSAYTNYSEYTVNRNITSQITICEGATATINTNSYPRIISTILDGESITANYGILNNGTLTISNASTNSVDFYGTGTSIRNNGTLNINGYTQIISSGKDGNTTVQDRLGIYNSGGTVNVNTTSFTIAYCGYRGVNNSGTFNMKGGNIHHCACPATNGGGVYNTGTFHMTGGSIYTNTATNGDGIHVASGTLKMSGTALVKSDDTVYLAGTTYVTVGDFTGDDSIRAYLKGDNFAAGRVVAKYATPSTGAGTDALYWTPDSPQQSQQYFAVSGKVLRAGDQGAAKNTASGIANEDVFISELYTLSFNGNLSGVSVTVPASVSRYWYETKSVTFANASTNVSYVTFAGWNTKADGSGNSYTSPLSYATNMNLTLYAQWEGISYTVKYNGNGATSGSTASSTHTYGVAKKLTANGFVKTGYVFTGWNTKADGTGTAYTDQQSVSNLATTEGAVVNLYAQWKAISYTVQYNGNGNTGGSTASSTHTYDVAKALTTNGFTKTGYTFAGWNTKADGSGTAYADKTSVKNLTSTSGGTVTLYAQWKAITYTVVYNGNGSTGGSTASSTHTYDVAKALTANGFTKTGYVFAGWNTKSDGSGTAYADKASVKNLTSTSGGTVTLYAQWKAITYTVVYNGNGSTGGSTASSTHTYDVAKALTANGFTKTGYVFAGWNTKADGSGTSYADKASVKNLSSTSGGTVTLYAQWKAIAYTVVYNGNGSTGGSTASSTHTYDVAKALTANGFTKTGYVFAGWNTKADGSGASYADKASVKNLTTTSGGTVTLYAQWTPITYTVVYNGNGATSGSTVSSTHTYGVAQKLSANCFIKTGHVFAGWNTKADGSGTSYDDQESVTNLASTQGATVTLYAQWEAASYTVVYNGNGNTGGSTASSKHSFNVAKTLTANGFVKTGYVFVGWNTKSDGTGTAYADKASVVNLTSTEGATVHLYAQWKAITYTIVYDGNGSTGGSTANSTHTYDTAKTLTANGFIRTGYIFAGWNTKADGSGTSYADKASVKNLTAVDGSTVRLYAQWTPISYTVKYDGNGSTGGATTSSTHVYDAAKALTANGYTRFGYVFAGWNTKADGSGTSYADKASVKNLTSTNGGTVTLYAQWAAISYTVIYNGNGNTGGSTDSSTHHYGALRALSPNGFTKTGYAFVGWNTQADGSGTSYADKASVLNLASVQGATVQLYAQWTPITYTVIYNGNGSTSGATASSTHVYDVAKALTANGFKRTGYVFVGWNTKADGSGTAYADGASVKNLTSTNGGTVTLYAQWKAITYTVVYNGNGNAGGSTASSTHTYDVAKALTANGFTRPGYKFAGWNTKADGSGTAYVDKASVKNLTATSGGTVTLYAQWELISYTIQYNGNGSTGGFTASSTHTYGVAKALTANGFVRTGYVFSGWNTKADGSGTSYADKASVVNLSATDGAKVTLYAQWTPIQYTVQYDGNGSTGGSTGSSMHTYDVAKTLTANGFVRTGYVFTGWNTKADGSGVSYADKVSVKNLTATSGGTVILYAQWKAISYTIQYNGNGATEGSTASSVHVYDVAQPLTTNGYLRTDYRFICWNTAPNGSGTSYFDGQSVLNLATEDGAVIKLYAIWLDLRDEGPTITAVDRWFTLEEARNGNITLEELMVTASAVDSSVGNFTDFAAGEGMFTIIDYSADDFLAFTKGGSVTVTYYARDLGLNEALVTVTVYIVDDGWTPSLAGDAEPKERAVRFISREFFIAPDGSFIGELDGGLSVASVWRFNDSYAELLREVLANERNDATWTRAPKYTFHFGEEAVKQMQAAAGSDLEEFFHRFLTS